MRTVVAILDARIDGFVSKMAAAGKAAASVGDSAKKMGKGAQREFEVLKDTAMQNEQSWNQVSNTIGAVGVAAGAVAGLAVREFAKFDQAMSGVASTGADAKNSIDALRESAIQQGADTAYSATEAAQGIEELARAGVAAQEILGGGLAGALSLAAAGQIGVADAAGLASIAMTQFNLAGKDIPHLADLLAAGAGKAMGGVSELGEALKNSGLVAAEFGIPIEEMVGTLSAFASQGLLGAEAGTSLKNMLLKLANPSKKAQQTMDDLGIAAYDTQGNFIGLEALAGQLSDKMGSLDDQTRQAALSTIFGSHSILAASALYTQGAEGVAEWTEAVDDSGYAAETAAELQNNLIGDLEKLGGSWSTLAIEMGGVADGPLRTMVQGLTGLVDIAGEAPGAAQSIMIAVTALAGLALGGAALMKGISGLAQYQTALATLASSSPAIASTATAIGKVGKAAGIAAVAIGGIMVVSEIARSFRDAAPAADDYASALLRAGDAADQLQASTQIDSLFEGVSGNLVRTGSELKNTLSTVNQFSTDFIGNFLGVNHAFDDATERLSNFDQALKGATFEDAVAGFQALATAGEEYAATGARWDLDDTLAQIPEYVAQVQKMAAEQGQAKLSSQELAEVLSGGTVNGFTLAGAASEGFVEAQETAASVMAETAAAAEAEADAMKSVLDAANAARDAIQGLNDANRDAANAFMGAEAASDSYIATLQGITDLIKANGTSLDQNTEKGRANRAGLRDLASSARDVTDAMHANGESVDVVNAKMSTQRGEFIKTIGQFGITGAAAEALADSYGLIPNYVETLVATPGAKLSKQEADDLNAALEGIPDDVKSEIITLANRSGYDEAMALLAQARNASATTYINIVTTRTNMVRNVGSASVPRMGAPVARAQGGPVYGPGTPTSDSIPAMLSNREWVLRAWAADKIGHDRLAYMNATGKIPHFNTGGQVTPNGPATMGAYTTGTATHNAPVTNTTYITVEGREAHALLADTIRYADRNQYQKNGVHRGNN